MLGSVLSTGAGFNLMYLESEIMMRVLEQLQHKAIVGLPVFDAVIVKASKAETTTAVMKQQFKKETGLDIQVRLEPCIANGHTLLAKDIYGRLIQLIRMKPHTYDDL
jgi:hypothetical protein